MAVGLMFFSSVLGSNTVVIKNIVLKRYAYAQD